MGGGGGLRALEGGDRVGRWAPGPSENRADVDRLRMGSPARVARTAASEGAEGGKVSGRRRRAQAELAAERAAEIARRQERQRLDRGRDVGPSR